MSTKSPKAAIEANARLVIDRFRTMSDLGMRFGYNRESVAWIDGFIERERRRTDITSDSVAKLVQIISSYLGECAIHAHGGEWRENEGTWGVFFDDKNAVFPFAKVQKQFQAGLSKGS